MVMPASVGTYSRLPLRAGVANRLVGVHRPLIPIGLQLEAPKIEQYDPDDDDPYEDGPQ